jgi:hypothetical protein
MGAHVARRHPDLASDLVDRERLVSDFGHAAKILCQK